jgi:hypothetical protein
MVHVRTVNRTWAFRRVMEQIIEYLVIVSVVTPMVLFALGYLKVPPEGHVAVNFARAAARWTFNKAHVWRSSWSLSWKSWRTNSTTCSIGENVTSAVAADSPGAVDYSWEEGVIPVPGYFWWDESSSAYYYQ